MTLFVVLSLGVSALKKNNNRPFSEIAMDTGGDLLEHETCKTVALNCIEIINWTDV